MIYNITNIGVVENKERQPIIRFSVSFREDGEKFANITLHGWLYGPSKTPTPPKSRAGRHYWKLADVSEECIKALKEYLDNNETIQGIFKDLEKIKRESTTLKSLGLEDIEIRR